MVARLSKASALTSGRYCSKNGYHHGDQVALRLHSIGQHRTRTTLRTDPSAAEEVAQAFEHDSMRLMLVHLEDRRQLPAVRCTGVGMDRHGEAAFSIDEANDPSRIE